MFFLNTILCKLQNVILCKYIIYMPNIYYILNIYLYIFYVYMYVISTLYYHLELLLERIYEKLISRTPINNGGSNNFINSGDARVNRIILTI